MNDEQLLRYSRHINLPAIGYEGQERLAQSSCLIVGLGGLGSAASLYLAASGIGRLWVADDDEVELSNLQRQLLFNADDLGLAKAEVGSRSLRRLNGDIAVEPVALRLDDDNLGEFVGRVDVVVDGCDNFATRYAVNRACAAAGKPLVSGAAIRMEGQVSVYPLDRGGPCYNCLYARADQAPAESCSESGVFAPIVGLVGSIQAAEAIKTLVGAGDCLHGRLLLIDMERAEFQQMKFDRDPQCTVCSQAAKRA